MDKGKKTVIVLCHLQFLLSWLREQTSCWSLWSESVNWRRQPRASGVSHIRSLAVIQPSPDMWQGFGGGPYARYFYKQGFFSANLFDTCFANLVHREVVINSSHNIFYSATSLKVSTRFDPRHWSRVVRGMLYSECTRFADRAVQSLLTGFRRGRNEGAQHVPVRFAIPVDPSVRFKKFDGGWTNFHGKLWSCWLTANWLKWGEVFLIARQSLRQSNDRADIMEPEVRLLRMQKPTTTSRQALLKPVHILGSFSTPD